MIRRAPLHTALTLCLACALAPAAAADTPAASAATKPPAQSAGTNLGKVDVKGTRATVDLLREMKGAINAPFSNDPKHVDDMVCRIEQNEGYRAQGVVLDCGTQGWFSSRRSNSTLDDVTNPDSKAKANLGHPWHVVRLLNYEQVQALRSLLGILPAPGKGEVRVVDGPVTAPAAASAMAPRH